MTAPRRPLLFRTAVPAHPAHASGVRRMVTAHLKLWRLSDLLDSAVLATAELFANAVRHTGGGARDVVTITLACTAEELQVTVADPCPRLPRPGIPDETAESGRGLAIVCALADDWGTAPPDPGSRGKKVWFTLSTKDCA
ncbi:ATP-binding protein [Streptomyces odontomachi]|uniref:ATP-binding protein n=1 Tax=Streptomyces odontomachi TaxID=2944940 RepID=UPI00210C02E6|nr:ATP-binding protein [Streptomyces sp. ODS25]